MSLKDRIFLGLVELSLTLRRIRPIVSHRASRGRRKTKMENLKVIALALAAFAAFVIGQGCAAPASQEPKAQTVGQLFPDELAAAQAAFLVVYPSLGDCDLSKTEVIFPNMRGMAALCPPNSLGCTGDKNSEIVVGPELLEVPVSSVIMHELMHRGRECYGLSGDPTHRDSRLWGPTGALARAVEALKR